MSSKIMLLFGVLLIVLTMTLGSALPALASEEEDEREFGFREFDDDPFFFRRPLQRTVILDDGRVIIIRRPLLQPFEFDDDFPVFRNPRLFDDDRFFFEREDD